FHAALEREPSQRSNFLAQVCEGDQPLRSEVESLLASHEGAENFIETPASDVAANLLAGGQDKLALGQTVGRYEILTLLGSGGMGEVYLARDKSLGRQIALKLLPAQFTTNADRVRRFDREARAASALNHPNIVTIHEIGQFDSTHFIATEFIDGVTLRERLAECPLKLDEALDIATQVAFALAAAHTAGIVHRDIKPDNVMLRSDGFVKVLDFGLAKLLPPETSIVEAEAPTKSMVRTNPGMVMGTVQYMSPEQARGLEVDARTDIWSLGVVLYEMVTGKVPFAGATSGDLIVSILDREPLPLSRYLPDLPPELHRIVSKALRKDREERYQVVKDLFIDLKSLRQELEFAARLQHSAQPESSGEIGRRAVTSDAVPSVGQQTKEVQIARATLGGEFPNRKPLLWTVGVVFGLLLLAAGAWYLSRLMTKPGPPLVALTAIPLTTDMGFEGTPSLSPDGNQVAYSSGGPENDNFDIYLKQIGGGPARRLTSDPASDEFPAWSPDGRSIAFIRNRGDKMEVLLIPSEGGPERKIAETAADTSTYTFNWTPPYLSWTPDSKYLVAPDLASPGEALSLFLFSVATLEKRRLTSPPATTLGDGNPAVSPDGRTLAFARILSPGLPQIHLLPLSEDYQAAGEPRHLDLSQPLAKSPVWTGDGREIVCEAGGRWAGGTLWRVAVSGSEKPQPLSSGGEAALQPTISRQGNRLVYVHWIWDMDIWRTEILRQGKTGPAVKLVASTRLENQPQYSPDDSKIVFVSDRSGRSEIWICNGDGSSPAQLTSLESHSAWPRWFPDGRRIIFDSGKEGATQIYMMDIATLVPRSLTKSHADSVTPSVSHDGEWIYFSSRPTGRWEIWRMPAEGGEAVQITRHGGEYPFESGNGSIVYYYKDQGVWKVPATGGEETRVIGPINGNAFAVTSEGIYFIEFGAPLFVGSRGNALEFFRFATRTSEKLADVRLTPDNGVSVSSDGRYALIPMVDPFVCDLMLVDNFH
ncbi:MAG: serine/threonine-protein kinase, partial [Pyrinomonadaceae bacterium]|nr:serine/threonine-protein kinase [Pyrinomonadaceae bacterium]